MSAIGSRAFAGPGAPGSYSNSAIAAEPTGDTPGKSDDDIVRAVKIERAMRSGPRRITRDATVAEMDHHGNVARVLRKGTNGWICMPGDENRIGTPPMCVDELGMQWFKDAMTGNRGRPITHQVSATCFVAQRNTATRTSRIGPVPPYPSVPTAKRTFAETPGPAKCQGVNRVFSAGARP